MRFLEKSLRAPTKAPLVRRARLCSARRRPPSRSRLTPREMDEFRGMLTSKRRQLEGDMTSLSDRGGRASRDHGSSGSMPIHMAERASDTWEQAFTLRLVGDKHAMLREIDDALQRIRDGTYGICEATGRAISKARLRALPWARHCIEYARQREAACG